jgi:hypothetical protein
VRIDAIEHSLLGPVANGEHRNFEIAPHCLPDALVRRFAKPGDLRMINSVQGSCRRRHYQLSDYFLVYAGLVVVHVRFA